ncbi:MAG: conjugal transfer protein TraF, partial [Deltaproteobacteria bacterium]|nr:conjugal transfer protein TraF [Deltaproteobacteria bacterium]
YMKARVYNTSVKVFNTDFGDALDRARNDYKDSHNFGVDLGMLYRNGDTLRAGLVGRNLNSPKFDMKPLLAGDDDYLKEKAQVRAGVAFKPVSFVTLALDYDLTKNDTTVSDSYKSQNLGGGVEVNVFKVVQVRAGAYKNMAQSDIGVVYTAGLGLNLWAVNLDLGAAMSPKSTTVDGSDIPKEVRAELALSMLF